MIEELRTFDPASVMTNRGVPKDSIYAYSRTAYLQFFVLFSIFLHFDRRAFVSVGLTSMFRLIFSLSS